MADRWWVVSEAVLLAALRDAAAGEDPDLLLLELEANSDTERIDP